MKWLYWLLESKGTRKVSKSVSDAALASVNELRAQHNVKPLRSLPRGVPGNSSYCPIARALRPIGVSTVGQNTISLGIEWIQSPEAIREFVHDFDIRHGV